MCKICKPCIQNIYERFQLSPEAIVCFLSPCNTPHLFNRIVIRRIGWKGDDCHSLFYIRILLFFEYKAFCFFVLGSVVHYKKEMALFSSWPIRNKFADAAYGGFIIEPKRLSDKKFSCFWQHKPTICHGFSAGIGLHLGLAPFLIPAASNC